MATYGSGPARASVELPDGSVVVPGHLVGEVLHLLAVALVHEARETGAQPSAAAGRLFASLHHAAQPRRVRHEPAADRFATESAVTAPSRLEISTADAAALLECSAQHVRSLVRSGRILGRRAGQRAWLIDAADFDRYRHGRRAR